jgi:hypothetical protein
MSFLYSKTYPKNVERINSNKIIPKTNINDHYIPQISISVYFMNLYSENRQNPAQLISFENEHSLTANEPNGMR